MLLELLVVGSTLYAGNRAYQQLKAKGGIPWPKYGLTTRTKALPAPSEPASPSPALQQANRTILISSASLGLAGAGSLLMIPALQLVSMPFMLYVFVPTFKSAWYSVHKERRVTNQVLDATRIVVCMVMGYNTIAAFNACLQAVSQQLFLRADEDFHKRLVDLLGAQASEVWIYHNNVEMQIPTAELAPGMVLALNAGERAPSDGTVLYGEAWVDQRVANGDAQRVFKARTDAILAGSMILSGQLYIQAERKVVPLLNDKILQTLERTAEYKTWTQKIGEMSAARMAPAMLLSFAIAWPLLGANQAAAFLTTGFGANMRTLGPHTVRNFVLAAAQQGILIKNARALEQANLVNTIIFDGRVLTDPAVRSDAKTIIHKLRQRPWLSARTSRQPFSVYVMVNHDEEELGRQLVAELGLDDYFAESMLVTRASLLEQLQLGGRMICYVGTGQNDEIVMNKALVGIAHRNLENSENNAAQIVLVDNDLRRLGNVFDFGLLFAAKQGTNLLAPIGVDLLDITTTLLIHFGLVYSVMFNYLGLLIGAWSAQLPPVRQQEEPAPPVEAPVSTLLPLLK